MSLFGSRISGFFGGTSGGGGGGTFNPTTDYIPYNQGGSWGDSWWYNSSVFTYTTDVLSGTRQAYGFLHSPLTYEQSIGDFNNLIKGDYIKIDNASEFIKTYMSASEYGVFIDRNLNSYLGDFAGNESYFQSNNTSGSSFVLARANNTGLKGDSATGITKIGDIDAQGNNITFQVDNVNNKIISSNNGSDGLGLFLDFSNTTYVLGDTFNNNQGYKVIIIDGSHISTAIETQEAGLYINSSVDTWVGDYNSINNGLYFKVDNTNTNFQTYVGANGLGLKIDTNNGIYQLGDFDGNINNTSFGVDDNNITLIASSNLIAVSGGPTQNRLKIKIGGVDYLIVLETP